MTRFASVAAFLLVTAMWLTFAWLMRDSHLIGHILGWGLFGLIWIALILLTGESREERRPTRSAPPESSTWATTRVETFAPKAAQTEQKGGNPNG